MISSGIEESDRGRLRLGTQRGIHRYRSDDIWDHSERTKSSGSHLANQPISRHLQINRHLIEPETALAELLGDDFFQAHERPAADEVDVGCVEGNVGLHRALLMASQPRSLTSCPINTPYHHVQRLVLTRLGGGLLGMDISFTIHSLTKHA
jgi:hypothetical protein